MTFGSRRGEHCISAQSDFHFVFAHMLLLMQQMDHSPHLQLLELQSPPTEIIGQSPLDWLEEGGGPRDILP